MSNDRLDAMISASMNNAQLTKDQFVEQCIQLINKKIKSGVGQETHDLARISRQVAIINLLAAFLVLLSVVVVFLMLL